MLPRQLRSWLALATLIALASCDLNPQPILPDERAAAEPEIGGGKGTGGTGSTIGEDQPGAMTPSGAGGDSASDSGGAPAVDSAAGGAGGQGDGGEAGTESSAAGAAGDAL
jgi:hypothetical protein